MSKKIEVTSPFDGKVVGEVPFSTTEEVEAAIDLAQKYFFQTTKMLYQNLKELKFRKL